MDYSEKIFEMLGVEPYEEFKIADEKETYVYRITNILRIEVKVDNAWLLSAFVHIRDILIGYKKIIKIQKPTKEEQLVIDYARLCGYNWIAKDPDGTCFAYSKKPFKSEKTWHVDFSDYTIASDLKYDLSFLFWEDKEPYYIGNNEDVE